MQYTQDALARAKKVKMLILDVDGVLTDGSIAVGDNGELFKIFNVRSRSFRCWNGTTPYSW